MPFLGSPNKNVNLEFYSIGFVNKILTESTSSSVTKVTGLSYVWLGFSF